MTVIFTGKWFTVEQEEVTTATGKTFLAESVSRTDGVRILARRRNGDLLVSDEYRVELGGRDLRLPGGKVEDGMSPLQAAQAELREETGFRAESWRELATTQAFSMVRYSLHYFEARDLVLDPVEHDEGEDIKVRWVPMSTAVDMALDGRIGEDLSALQILRLGAREESV